MCKHILQKREREKERVQQVGLLLALHTTNLGLIFIVPWGLPEWFLRWDPGVISEPHWGLPRNWEEKK